MVHFNGPQTKYIGDSLYKHPVDTYTQYLNIYTQHLDIYIQYLDI